MVQAQLGPLREVSSHSSITARRGRLKVQNSIFHCSGGVTQAFPNGHVALCVLVSPPKAPEHQIQGVLVSRL